MCTGRQTGTRSLWLLLLRERKCNDKSWATTVELLLCHRVIFASEMVDIVLRAYIHVQYSCLPKCVEFCVLCPNDAIRLLKVKNTQRNSHTLIIIMFVHLKCVFGSLSIFSYFYFCVCVFTVATAKAESFIIYDADFGLRLHNNKYPQPSPYTYTGDGPRFVRTTSTQTEKKKKKKRESKKADDFVTL